MGGLAEMEPEMPTTGKRGNLRSVMAVSTELYSRIHWLRRAGAGSGLPSER